jgi:allantoate deiminase
MRLRRDAFAGAAEAVLLAEAEARGCPGLAATVGQVFLAPGAPNVIPGEAILTLDLRHPEDAVRRRALGRIVAQARAAARRRRLGLDWQPTQDDDGIICSPDLTALLAQSVRSVQGKGAALVSGAGHDAVVMSVLAPVAMLFVRCRDGLSHHPDEHAAPRDLGVALQVVMDFLERLAVAGPAEAGRRGQRHRLQR